MNKRHRGRARRTLLSRFDFTDSGSFPWKKQRFEKKKKRDFLAATITNKRNSSASCTDWWPLKYQTVWSVVKHTTIMSVVIAGHSEHGIAHHAVWYQMNWATGLHIRPWANSSAVRIKLPHCSFPSSEVNVAYLHPPSHTRSIKHSCVNKRRLWIDQRL